MKMFSGVCMVVTALLASCAIQAGTWQPMPSQQGNSEEWMQVTSCQLMETPWRYDHRLVEVSADVSFGFEEFNLWPSHCKAQIKSGGVWLAYGDRNNSRGLHEYGETAPRADSLPLVVEGVPCELRKDAAFKIFDKLIHRGGEVAVHATLIGRFFAGRPLPTSSKLWGGYGQMGGYSLLVITQVTSSSPLKTMLPSPPPES